MPKRYATLKGVCKIGPDRFLQALLERAGRTLDALPETRTDVSLELYRLVGRDKLELVRPGVFKPTGEGRTTSRGGPEQGG